MSFRIQISPNRKRSNTGMPQTARILKPTISSSLITLIEEIKCQMKQFNQPFQNLLLELFKIALELERKNIKYLSSQQTNKPVTSQQLIEPSQKENSQNIERMRSIEKSPSKRDQIVKYIEMSQSSKLDPTPRQKLTIRRSSLEFEQQMSKDQLRKISQDAIDQNYIFSLLDFKNNTLKSMNYKKFNSIFSMNEKDLYQYLQKLEYQDYKYQLYEPINFIKNLSSHTLNYLEKLKKIIKLRFLTYSANPCEKFEQYQMNILEILECDRAYIYLYDDKQQIFWTKNSQNTLKQYISIKGIPAYVLKQGQLININDVYSDVRFDQEYDIKQKEKTKSMIVAPIIDEKLIIGVIVASSTQNVFKKDAEILITILAQSCKSDFSQLLLQEYNSKTCEAIQQITKFSLALSSCNDQSQLIVLSQQILEQHYELKQAQVFLKDMQDKDSIFTYINGQRKKSIVNCGIIGHVFKKGQYYGADSCYRDKFYNKLVDIETNLPTITIPIKSDEKVMGVIQYIDTKGIDNITGRNLKNLQLSNIDIIQTFAIMISFINNMLIIQKGH